MTSTSHLAGIQFCRIKTPRLEHYLLSCGDADRTPVFFIHGNFSSSSYYEELMLAMPDNYYCLAPDLRGYGDSENKTIDARRGARDWSDDLLSLMSTLNIKRAHFVGWSTGAAPILQLAIDKPEAVLSLCLVAPVSPFGFGGSKTPQGVPCNNDFSGSGGGTVNSGFIERLLADDHSSAEALSPRNVIRNSFFSKPRILEREDDLLAASMKQALGPQQYPGDFGHSNNWPNITPGDFGPINAISAKHLKLSDFVNIEPKPPVLWIHGSDDKIISDHSFSDFGYLGQQGLVEGWPGDKLYPPQPMVSQTRYLLEQYGNYQEVEMADVGHSPFLEKPVEFLQVFCQHLVGEKITLTER